MQKSKMVLQNLHSSSENHIFSSLAPGMRPKNSGAVAAACGGATVHVLPADLLEVDAHELAAQAEALAGPIDVLVANAGQSQRGTAIDTDMSVKMPVSWPHRFTVFTNFVDRSLGFSTGDGNLIRGGLHIGEHQSDNGSGDDKPAT